MQFRDGYTYRDGIMWMVKCFHVLIQFSFFYFYLFFQKSFSLYKEKLVITCCVLFSAVSLRSIKKLIKAIILLFLPITLSGAGSSLTFFYIVMIHFYVVIE